MDYYTTTIQPEINSIILNGNINLLLGQVSQLFIGASSIYIGTDYAQHYINYTTYTYNSSPTIVNMGVLPIGTGTGPNNTYTIDITQNIYSMQPLIDYVSAYIALKQFAYPSVGGNNNPSSVKPLDYNTYITYVNAYNGLKTYFLNFPTTVSYNVLLYQFNSNQSLLVTYLQNIQTLLFGATFSTYVSNLINDYQQTIYYETGSTAVGVYVLSRTTAILARSGGRKVTIP